MTNTGLLTIRTRLVASSGDRSPILALAAPPAIQYAHHGKALLPTARSRRFALRWKRQDPEHKKHCRRYDRE